jgi:uncharacterized membrane protein YgaE (UPF0421/DUF939 family)
MESSPAFAPADHLNDDRERLTQLSSAVLALRRGLPVLRRMLGGCQHGIISAVAAVLAYLPAQPLGLKEGFWASITAISVTQTEFHAAQSTARDQAVGALIGGMVGVCASTLAGRSLWLYAAAIAFSMLICWGLNVASASRLAGSTATIVILVPHEGSVERMLISRLTEVGWGICVAVAVVWLAGRLPAKIWPRATSA